MVSGGGCEIWIQPLVLGRGEGSHGVSLLKHIWRG